MGNITFFFERFPYFEIYVWNWFIIIWFVAQETRYIENDQFQEWFFFGFMNTFLPVWWCLIFYFHCVSFVIMLWDIAWFLCHQQYYWNIFLAFFDYNKWVHKSQSICDQPETATRHTAVSFIKLIVDGIVIFHSQQD